VVFYDAVEQISDWARARRRAVRTPIGIEHLMASAAIPLHVSGRCAIEVTGRAASLRRRLDAADHAHRPGPSTWARSACWWSAQQRARAGGRGRPPATRPTSLAQVANHALASIFLDTLTADAERLHRINHTLSLIEPARRAESALRPIELLTIMPLQRAGPGHALSATLPRPVRTLMAILGMRGAHLARARRWPPT
jgi:NTE family protein